MKTIKKLKALKIAIIGAIAAGGVITVVSAAAAIWTFAAGRMRKIKYTKESQLSKKKLLLLTSIIAGFTSGTTGLMTIAGTIGAPILKPALFTSGLKSVRRLEQIEKNNPGTLSSKEKKMIVKLKKLYRSTLLRGIVKGIRLKIALEAAAESALKQNVMLISSLGGAKNAFDTIKNYIQSVWQETNITQALTTYQEQIKQIKKARDKYSKWNPKYHIQNAKLIRLKLIRRNLKNKLKKARAIIYKLNNQYNMAERLTNSLQLFIEKAKTIMADLMAPVKEKKEE